MTLSRKVRTAGVGLKSYLSSGMTSTIAMTRLRVLSHVALAGVRKLVAGKPGWAAAAPTVPSIASTATTTLRVNEFLVIQADPPVGCRVLASELRERSPLAAETRDGVQDDNRTSRPRFRSRSKCPLAVHVW